MPVAAPKPRRRVAVADDNPANLDQKSDIVNLAGYDAVPLRGRYNTVQDLLDAIARERVSGLVCDHKLNEGDYAGFEGVEAVSALYGLMTPALLVTDYVDTDLKQSIRRHRRQVPVLIRGSDLRPRVITAGFETWEREVLHHDVPPERRPMRTFVEIDDISEGPAGRMLTVFVPRWQEYEAVTLPEEMIPQELRPQLKKGTILTAHVNVEAQRPEDLFFDRFQLTPDEDLTREPA